MANIETTYLGLSLKSPVVVAASSLSNMIDRIQRAEEAGAGALVIRSLFEEQVKMEEAAFRKDARLIPAEHLEEARVYFPLLNEDAARAHVMWVKKARAAVKMPLIASLNAHAMGTWTLYASELARAGADALELNVYSVPADLTRTGSAIEQELFDMVTAVRAAVHIPVSVKLAPFYTSVANVAYELSRRGAKGLVLFNRFLQPDINLETMSLDNEMVFSTPQEMKLPLRWVALLYGRIEADLALTTGVHSGQDVVKAILAGAQVVQVAAALYQHGLEHIGKLNADLAAWMDQNNLPNLAAFRGSLSQQKTSDPSAFERAQYVNLLTSI
jgi:dihydroorotate dehydrogenase (fumarate)